MHCAATFINYQFFTTFLFITKSVVQFFRWLSLSKPRYLMIFVILHFDTSTRSAATGSGGGLTIYCFTTFLLITKSFVLTLTV